MFSVYLKMTTGNSTHIKFGGYDKEGIMPGKKLHFLQTKAPHTWQLKMTNYVKFGEDIVDITKYSSYKQRYALFELAYPYIYVPKADFT